MVKKTDFPDPKSLVEGLFEGLNGPMKDSAQQIWLAGLGAFAKAQQEGGRVFEALVKEGAALQQHAPVAGARFAEAAAKAAQPWERLETMFEERVAKALERLGTPSTAQVEALEKRIALLEARSKAAVKTAAKKTVARKKA